MIYDSSPSSNATTRRTRSARPGASRSGCQLLAVRDRHTIASRLHRLHEDVVLAELPEATRLAETVDAWWPQILGFLETGITSAGTEGTSRLAKDAARTAFGFRNLENQRRRVRFHCTRQSRRTTSAEAALPLQI